MAKRVISQAGSWVFVATTEDMENMSVDSDRIVGISESVREMMECDTFEDMRTLLSMNGGDSGLQLGLTPTTAKPGNWHPSSQEITDASEIGRSILTASSGEDIRSAIGAGTSNLSIGTSAGTAKSGDYSPSLNDVSGISDTGKSLLTADSKSDARSAIDAGTSSLQIGTTSITAKRGDYKPSAADIEDSGSVGQSLIKSSTVASALTAVSGNAPDEAKFLRGDGSWQTPTNTTYGNATQSAAGLMSSTDKTKLDGISASSSSAISAGGRAVGSAFTVSATRNAMCSYTMEYALTATLALGQNITLVATVDGIEVARFADAILLGLAGVLTKSTCLSFFVPAGKQVLFTKTGTAAVTATVKSGQEILL
ncbi:hypothetical protein B7L51_019410 [Pectobacterium brasiliense]|uniref:hypothetical protein n=1 Tax=Pectobacterium brasiliense TaxID=180957 RepID=UPI000B963688|nr:hypothetical protein [Pectobacterium carotovorum]OYN49449.1 hypothetical protein B7L51_19460 [Pectobacterium carotovorum]